jgi:hypothetical protein
MRPSRPDAIRRSRPALWLGAFELLLFACSVPLGVLAHQLTFGGFWSGAAIAAPFGVVGVLVASRRPSLRMGWLMLGVSGIVVIGFTTQYYSILAFRQHDNLPLGSLALVLEPSWPTLIVPLGLSILLYPDGHAPSARWKWPLRWLLAITAAATLVAAAVAVYSVIAGTAKVASDGTLQKLYASNTVPVWGICAVLTIVTAAVMLLTWLVTQALRFRHMTGERRAQQKLIMVGAGVAFACTFTLLSNASYTNYTALGLSALPLAMGVGILKYRLYDIDRLVSRTLSYAIVSALLVGAFVGLVALSTDVLAFSSSVGVAASTLVAAALFNPVRGRVQRAVDRRFNRAQYDAAGTVAAFAAKLRDAVDLDAVQSELLEVVQRAVEPAHATIWIRPTATTQPGSIHRE